MYYIHTPDAVIRHFTHDALGRIIYLHRRGAFSVARFDLQGSAKALTRGTGRGLAPRLNQYMFYKCLKSKETLRYQAQMIP